MEVDRCANCMEDIRGISGRICPACGFDNSGDRMQPVPHAIRVDTILHGRYLIGRVLGQGGFGLTYIAYDFALESRAVVKEYFPLGIAERSYHSDSLVWDPEFSGEEQRAEGYRRIREEVRRVMEADKDGSGETPSIVRARDVFQENGTIYIVMDYVKGVTLKDRIKEKGPMSFSKCVNLLAPVMEDLEKVHRMGFVHRDISPDNIILLPDGSVRLLDFGAAMDIAELSGSGDSAQFQIVVKRGFGPPEQYMREGKIGPWTDVYALSATVFYCLTGKKIPSALDRINSREIPWPSDLKQERKDALEAGLSLDPQKRIQTAGELLTRLRGSTGKRRSRKKPAAVLAAVFVFALAAIAGWHMLGPSARVSVKQIGTTSSNLLNMGYAAEYPQEYLYFIGCDYALNLCEYDEAEGTFHMEDARRVCDCTAYISLGEDQVYFEKQAKNDNALCRMNKDGSGITELCSSEGKELFKAVQYVKFSDDRDYVYYILQDIADGSIANLYRYDLKKGEEELLIEGSLNWYNLYGDTLYYTDISDDQTEWIVKKADPDGRNSETLIEGKNIGMGLFADDTFLAYSLKDEALLAYNPDGTEKEGTVGLYDLNVDFNNTISCIDGWIYYTDKKDSSIHRARMDGTGDELAAEGHTGLLMCQVGDGPVWLWEMVPVEIEHQYRMELFLLSEENEISGGYLEPWYTWQLPILAYKEDFEYTDYEDGSGVVITGYKGPYASFEIPFEIDGKPVIGIADHAFEGTEIMEVGLPENLGFIGERAFFGCRNLTFVGLPGTLEVIGSAAFGSCARLASVVLPERLHVIEELAFAEDALSEVFIPKNVTNIGDGAFAESADSGFAAFAADKENRFFEVRDGVLFGSRDGKTAIYGVPVDLAGIYAVPGDVQVLGRFSFAHCRKLEGVEIPPGVALIEENAFYDVSFGEIAVSAACELQGDPGSGIKISYY